MTKWLLIAGFSFLGAGLNADVQTYSAASNGGRFANVSADPGSVAMAGASVAEGGGVGSLGINPAGLSQLKGLQADFAHNFWVLDLSQEHVAAAMPFAFGGLAASVDYLDLGSVDAYTVGANNTPIANGSLHPYAYTASLGLGRELWKGLALGVSAKMLGQYLGSSTGLAAALDLGGQWQTPLKGLALGLAARNIGTPLEGSALPIHLRSGLSYALPLASRQASMRLAADLGWNADSQDAPSLSLGEDFWPTRTFAIRAGYQFGNDQVPTGFTAGLGLRHAMLQLDYAYDARSSFSAVHQMSLTIDLGPRPEPEPLPNSDSYAGVVDAIHEGDLAKATTYAAQLSQAQQANLKETYETYISPSVYQGDLAKAELIAKVLVQLEPSNAVYQERLGIIEWHLKKYDEANEHLKRAMILDPSRTDLLNKLSK